MKKLIILLIFICIYTTTFAFEKGTYDYRTHWVYSGGSIVLGWDPVTNAVEYEVVAEHLETEQTIIMGTTSNTKITIVIPRVGHFIFKVRAVNYCNEEKQVSEWATTIDSYPSDGKPSWVYSQLAPATDLILQ